MATIKGVAQFTITDLNDITTSSVAPSSPTLGQLWVNTSISPNLLKKWNGTVWETVNDYSAAIASVTTTTNTNTTAITSIQGQITTLISNTTITTNGVTTQLKDAYNGTVATVSSILTTVGTHTTDINTANGNITTVTSNLATLQITVNTINATLTSTNSTVAVHTTQISTANTNIATLNTNISSVTSRVTAVELTASGLTTRVGATETAISSLQIGGRNLINTSYTPVANNDTGSDLTITPYVYNGIKGYRLTKTTNGGWGSYLKWNIINNTIKDTTSHYSFSVYTVNLSTSLTSTVSAFFANGGSLNSMLNTNSQTVSTTGTIYKFENMTVNSSYNASNADTSWHLNLGICDLFIAQPKLEIGTKCTDYTPAPEDVDASIAAVQTYATTTINSNVSTINQTTTSIQANVTALQSSVSTINTTLGNKADTTTVTAISNRTATLEASVTGINASITTLNSNVSSVTTTANSALTAINNLQVGGRNLVRESTFKYAALPVNANFILVTVNNVSSQNFTNEGYHYTATSTNGAINSSMGIKINSNSFGLKVGDTISFSSDIKGTFGTSNNGLCVMHATTTNSTFYAVVSGSTLHPTAITDWTRKSRTYTIPSSIKIESDGSFYLYLFLGGGTGSAVDVYIRNVKVELGNKPTDWTPAPEDTDSRITTINSNISSLQSSVSILQNQIALKVEQTNIDTAVATLNGQITSTNASITSLQSSINLQLNSITSTVSKTVSTKNLINNSAFNNTLGDYNAQNTVTVCRIVKSNEYIGWGYVKPPVSDNVLAIRYDMTGDNYIEFKNLFAKVKPNTTYTLSYYYTMNGEYTGPSSFIYERTAAQWNVVGYTAPTIIGPDAVTARSTWVRYSKTFTTQSTTDSIMLRFGFHQIHSSGFCEMLITGIQLESGSSATDWVDSTISQVGTSIIQSTTDVMTAFNNISSYFQVSADGAKFGDIASGDYTLMSSAGMQHHIGSTNYNYFYISYAQYISLTLPSNTSPYSATFSYDSTLMTLLNGRTPLSILVTIRAASANYESGYAITGQSIYAWCSGITSSNFTVTATAIFYKINSLQAVDTNRVLNWKSVSGGTTLDIEVIIIA